MHVLIYTRNWAPLVGGIETITATLAQGLADWPKTHEGENISVTLVTRTPANGMDDSAMPYRVVRKPSAWRLIQLIREADAMHFAGPAILPLVLALTLGKPVVVEHHGFQAACPNGLLFFEPTQSPCPGHFMAKRYHKCIECNHAAAGTAKSFYMLATTHVRRRLGNWVKCNITPTNWLGTVLKLKRMRTIYHGVSLASFVQTGPASTSNFAYQGRLVSTKGVGFLIDAMDSFAKEGEDVSLKIIGDGPEQESLKNRAAALEGRIRFLGRVSDAQVDAALGDTASVVMPSLGGEVFGLVAAENMGRGKLLIVSDIGALREVVGDTGFVFRTGDAKDLASCMRKAASDPGLTAALSSAARARATQMFSQSGMVQAHVSLYREILQRPQ